MGGVAIDEHPTAKLTEAQRLDASYFNSLWLELCERGQIEPEVVSDEELWRRDLGHSLRVACEWLGDLRARQVLELGCGAGDYTIMMARHGAHVTAIDIAPASLAITRRRAGRSGVDPAVGASCAAAEQLPFPAETFDWVVGFGLLHHADLIALGPEVRRVLRPSGRALFREPLGTNPVLQFAREHLPYRDKHRSPSENPLNYADIARLGGHFRSTRVREFYLLSMIYRVAGSEVAVPALWALDELLIRHLPPVRRWCRYVLVEYAA